VPGKVVQVAVNELDDTVLVLAAWKRPDYFRAVLDSWGRARWVESLRGITVALGLSDVQNEMEQILFLAAGRYNFPPVLVTLDDTQASAAGPNRAIAEAVNRTFGRDPSCGFVIISEEDIQVSSDVLEFLVWGRGAVGQSRALAVCAHNARGSGWTRDAPDDTDADQQAARFLRTFSPWCWATWRETWQGVIEPDWDYDLNKGPAPEQHGWDWQMQRLVERTGPVLVPDASRCQNIGRERGVFADPDDFEWTQSRSFRENRPPMTYRLV